MEYMKDAIEKARQEREQSQAVPQRAPSAPEPAKAFAMPANDCLRLHNNQHVAPTR